MPDMRTRSERDKIMHIIASPIEKREIERERNDDENHYQKPKCINNHFKSCFIICARRASLSLSGNNMQLSMCSVAPHAFHTRCTMRCVNNNICSRFNRRSNGNERERRRVEKKPPKTERTGVEKMRN